MLESLQQRLRDALPAEADFCSARYVEDADETLAVRQDVPQPMLRMRGRGVMFTAVAGKGLGYAATSDLSHSGMTRAARQALWWAKHTADRGVTDFSKIHYARPNGEYLGPEDQPWTETSIEDKFALLAERSAALKADDRIVDWEASLWRTESEMLYVTSDDSAVYQRRCFMAPDLRVTAAEGAIAQVRSLGGRGYCQQGGMEVLDRVGFHAEGPRIAAEAVELLSAENCPTGPMDLLLAPDQMILQIHESIGHPLELDRILGDERNYAGTSFVKLDMFGTYRYGTELLNVTFDPSRPIQLATYGYDDEGQPAKKQHVIEKGILKRPLGGATSQARAGLSGVANCRAEWWNRPPIDRMANLNLEPGETTFDEMISSVERGVYMATNCSWSIDDSRNKFQFGCEWGRRIEEGKLTRLVRNANYRGISATFWRSLKAVGRAEEMAVMGTPYCGKGEPNQIIRVGHASPPCLFENVDVFGGV